MNYLKTISNKLNNLDKKIKKIMTIGIKFSLSLSLLAVIILTTYMTLYSLPNLFYIGITLLHTSLMYICAFLILGIGFDTIKKQLEN